MHRLSGKSEPPKGHRPLQRLARWAIDQIAPETAKPLPRILSVPRDRASKDFDPAILSIQKWMLAFSRSRHVLPEAREDIAHELVAAVLAAADLGESWITRPPSVAARGKTLVLEHLSRGARRARMGERHAAEIEETLRAVGHLRTPEENADLAELYAVINATMVEMPHVVAAALWWLTDEPPRTFAEIAVLFGMSKSTIRDMVAEARAHLVVALTAAGLDSHLAALDGPSRATTVPASERPLLPSVPGFADPAAFRKPKPFAPGRATP